MKFHTLARGSTAAAFAVCLSVLTANAAPLTQGAVINLWGDHAAPGSENVKLTERVISDEGGPADPQRSIDRILVPTITAHLPFKPNGAAVVITAGGGYTNIVIDKEGSDIARWLNTIGITAFVLKSRLPGEGHVDGKLVPLQDGQRAMRIVRANAQEWKIDPARVGFVGLSSGGHFASMVGTNYKREVYAPRDDWDKVSARPDFLILGYGPHSSNARAHLVDPNQKPVTPLQKQELYDEFPTDQQITAETPPAFIFCTDADNKVSPINSVRFYLGLKKAGLPAELHIYQHGLHGVAIRNTSGLPVADWPRAAAAWMTQVGVIGK